MSKDKTPPSYGNSISVGMELPEPGSRRITVAKGLALVRACNQKKFYDPFFECFGNKPRGWWWWSTAEKQEYICGQLYSMYPELTMWEQVNALFASPPSLDPRNNVTGMQTAMDEWHKQIVALCPLKIELETAPLHVRVAAVRAAMCTTYLRSE